MKFPTFERLVWPGMVLAGVALAASVWIAWPEPTLRVIRLPTGESMPKTASAEVPAPAVVRVVRAAPAPAEAAPLSTPALTPDVPEPVEAESETGRVLAVLDRGSAAGPAPMPSELERSGDYDQESPEELGAEPLPGSELTPEPQPASG